MRRDIRPCAHCIIILLPYVAHKFDLESTHVLNVPNIQKGVYVIVANITWMQGKIEISKMSNLFIHAAKKTLFENVNKLLKKL